jgi:hypothetical protein
MFMGIVKSYPLFVIIMKLYFSLNQALECGKVCKHLTKAINEYLESNGNIQNAILVIEIKDSIENETLPNLEYQYDKESC